MAGSMPVGASIPNHPVTSKPGLTVSAMVGTAGNTAERFAEVTASGRSEFPVDEADGARDGVEAEVDRSAQQRDVRRARTWEVNRRRIEANRATQHDRRERRERSAPSSGSEIQLARRRLGGIDELLDRMVRRLRIDKDHDGRLRQRDHRNEVFPLVVREIGKQCRRAGMPAGDKQETGPVRLRLRYGGGGDRAARARPVLYDDGLPNVILELLRDKPRQHIGRTSGRDPT